MERRLRQGRECCTRSLTNCSAQGLRTTWATGGPGRRPYETIPDQEMALYSRDVLEAVSAVGDDAKPLSEKDWRDAIASSYSLMPDYVARTVEETTAPTKNWKDELARLVHANRKSDTRTWNQPSRRVPGLSGWNREIDTNIVICIDTSGSVTQKMLSGFVAECRAIVEISGVTAVVISADAAVPKSCSPETRYPYAEGRRRDKLCARFARGRELRAQRHHLFNRRRRRVSEGLFISRAVGSHQTTCGSIRRENSTGGQFRWQLDQQDSGAE